MPACATGARLTKSAAHVSTAENGHTRCSRKNARDTGRACAETFQRVTAASSCRSRLRRNQNYQSLHSTGNRGSGPHEQNAPVLIVARGCSFRVPGSWLQPGRRNIARFDHEPPRTARTPQKRQRPDRSLGVSRVAAKIPALHALAAGSRSRSPHEATAVLNRLIALPHSARVPSGVVSMPIPGTITNPCRPTRNRVARIG